MPFRLSNLKLDRVDLVGDGANPGAEIMLFKSKEASVPQKETKKKVPAKKTAKPDARSKSKQRGDEDEEEEEDDEAVAKSDDDEDEDDLDEETDDDELEDDDDDDEPVGKKKKAVAKKDDKKKLVLKKKMKKSQTDDDDDEELDGIGDEDLDDDVEEVDEAVLKGLAPGVRRIIEKQNARLREVQKQVKESRDLVAVEKDRRVTLEFIEKAKKDIPNLTGTAEEKGDMFKALYSGQPIVKKMADAIVKLLKSADTAVHTLLMTESGSRRAQSDEEQDAITELREKADEIRKAEPKLSKEQAFEKACHDNPKLFNQYKVEKRRTSRAVDIQ